MKFLINILKHEKQTYKFTILSNLEFFESSLFIKIRVFIQGQLPNYDIYNNFISKIDVRNQGGANVGLAKKSQKI